jgi:hypothetical protein
MAPARRRKFRSTGKNEPAFEPFGLKRVFSSSHAFFDEEEKELPFFLFLLRDPEVAVLAFFEARSLFSSKALMFYHNVVYIIKSFHIF